MHQPAPLRSTPRQRLALLAILLASLGLRVWYAVAVHDRQLVTVPYLDTHDYHVWARALASGDWGVGRPYWMGPLYPHLLALSYVLFGVGSQALLLAQGALTLLNLWLVWLLARRWLAPGWAVLAVALYAGYGPPVFYAGFELMVTVVTTLLLVIAWQAGRACERPTRGRWLVLGLLVGVCATARGNALLLLALLPSLLVGRHAATGRRDVVRLVGWLWLGGVLAIAPVTVRNVVVGGDLVLLTSNAGVNLLIGQQAQYGGRFGPLSETPQFEFDPTGETLLEAELGRELRPSQVSHRLTRRALARLARDPGEMLAHYARKTYRFWSGYELPQIYSWNFWHHRLDPLRWFPVAAVWLLGPGLVGGALALGGPARRLWSLLVLGWFASLVPFFPTSRYRQPIMGLLAIGVAAWLAAVVTRWRDGRRRQATLLVAAAALLVLALWPGWSRLDPVDEAWHCHLNRASRAADAGDRAGMLAAVAVAEELRPGRAETPYRQGGYHEKLDDAEGALQAYLVAARRAPQNPFVLYRVGRSLAEVGRHREALTWYDRAARVDPAWSFPWHGRALSLRGLGRFDDAVATMREAIAREPGRARYRGNLASLLAEAGRPDEALRLLEALVRDFPEYVPGWFNLAVARLEEGDPEGARAALARAAAAPDATPAQRASIASLRRRLDKAPGPAP